MAFSIKKVELILRPTKITATGHKFPLFPGYAIA